MAENLNIETGNSKCYDNDPANCQKYGRLYDWNTAKTACPSGWHLPSDEELETLVNFAGGSEVAGKKLKAKSGWNDYAGKIGNGTDDFGFSALPGGYCNEDSNFSAVGGYGLWWSATESNSNNAYYREIGYNGEDNAESVGWDYRNKDNSFSIRCIQN